MTVVLLTWIGFATVTVVLLTCIVGFFFVIGIGTGLLHIAGVPPVPLHIEL